jgi:hypothetical protein
MRLARRITGSVALGTYLVMGALLHFTVIPGAGGHYPPDFYLLGYDAAAITPFLAALTPEAGRAYAAVLAGWDRVFAVALAAWLALVGWRRGGLRVLVAGLAALYAGIDLAENAAIHRLAVGAAPDAAAVRAASALTQAKFASLYLVVLVLIWHLRRPHP